MSLVALKIETFYQKVDRYFFNRKALVSCSILWLFLMLVCVSVFKDTSWWSDTGLYQYYATQCFGRNTMYPDYPFYYSEYIFAPGWVNIMILWLKLFGNFDNITYLVALFNFVNLILTYKIAAKLTHSKAIKYSVAYLYMLLPAFFTSSMTLYSEMSYITFASLSFLLLLYRRYWTIALSGLCIAIAYWIRPIAPAWILAAVFYLVFVHKSWRHLVVYTSLLVITCATIGISTHRNFPGYPYAANTGGVNMIMGANDLADGGYNFAARAEGGLGYIPGLRDSTNMTPVALYKGDKNYIAGYGTQWNCYQCDSIYKSRSIEWITTHPIKWLSLVPTKVYYLFFCGSFVYYPISSRCMVAVVSLWDKCMVGLIFLLSVMLLFTPMWRNKEMIYVFIPIFLASALTIVCVTHPRYNFAFLNLMIIFSVYSLRYFYRLFKAYTQKEQTHSIS